MKLVIRLILAVICSQLTVAWTPAADIAAQGIAVANDRGVESSEKPSRQKQEEPASKAGHEAPIDCPLRRQGVDPGDLKPFEEVEKYIAFLERPDRADWQKPEVVIETLALQGTETVSDLGAGSGYFSFRLAEALPRGRVRAIDVEPEMIRHIHHKAMSTGAANIEAVLATPDDPHVSLDSDVVFVCDVLHHVEDRLLWLQQIHDTVRPGARLVLIEFREGELPEGPPESIKIPKREMMALAEQAGFRLKEDHERLLPYQNFVVFEKP